MTPEERRLDSLEKKAHISRPGRRAWLPVECCTDVGMNCRLVVSITPGMYVSYKHHGNYINRATALAVLGIGQEEKHPMIPEELENELTRLRLKDGDIVVWRTNDPASASWSLADLFKNKEFPEGVAVLLIQPDESFDVLTDETLAQAGLRRVKPQAPIDTSP